MAVPEMHEYRTHKIFGVTIKVQLPELINPTLNEIKMILRDPRYSIFLIIRVPYKFKMFLKTSIFKLN